jgi:hypothetical protein
MKAVMGQKGWLTSKMIDESTFHMNLESASMAIDGMTGGGRSVYIYLTSRSSYPTEFRILA